MIDGKAVARLRRERKMSQTALAAAVGCAQSLIQKIERGGAVRTKYHLEIAQALGVQPGEIQAGGAGGVRETRGEYVVTLSRSVEPDGRTAPASADQVLKAIEADVRAGRLDDAGMQLLGDFAELIKSARRA